MLFRSISPVDALDIYISDKWIGFLLCVFSMKLFSLIVCGFTIIAGVAAAVFPVLSGLPTRWAYNSCWM